MKTFDRLKSLQMSSTYLRDYIDRELENCLPNLNPETRSRLANIAEAFVNNQVSFNYALNVFTECSCPPSLITKFAHIKAVGGDPLPMANTAQSTSNSIPKEPSQPSIQESQPKLNDTRADQASGFSSSSTNVVQPGLSFPQEQARTDQYSIYKPNTKQNNNNGFEILNMNENTNFQNNFCLTKSYTRKKAAVWTEEEDLRLLTAVSRFGNHDWRMISAFVGSGRTSSQCNQRWTRALNPSISHHPWTPQEDQKLFDLVSQMGECGWRKIASYLNGRTDLQCRHRYLQMKRTKEKEIQKENEMKMNSGSGISSTAIPPFRNLPISNLPQEMISPDSNATLHQNNFPQNHFCLPPQNVAPFVIVQNNIINYNYPVNQNLPLSLNSAEIPISENSNAKNDLNDQPNSNNIIRINNDEKPANNIKIDEELLNSLINGNMPSPSAITSLPPLETIKEIPFQRVPPLLFKRNNNNV